MVKVDSRRFEMLLASIDSSIKTMSHSRSRTMSIREDLYNYGVSMLKQDIEDTIRSTLESNSEASRYPDIIKLLVDVTLEYMDNMNGFYELTGIQFERDGRPFVLSADLSILGDYQDFVNGKLYAGGKEKGDEVSAKKWYFIYQDFVSGGKTKKGEISKKSQKYKDIMSRRIEYWEANSVAPMWYWFSNQVSTKYAYPYQENVFLERSVTDAVHNFLWEIKNVLDFAYDPDQIPDEPPEEPEGIAINVIPLVTIQKFIPESLDFDVKIVLEGKRGKKIISPDFLIDKLRSGAWYVTFSYTTRIGGEDVIVSAIHRRTESGRREFTGYRLEYR